MIAETALNGIPNNGVASFEENLGERQWERRTC